MANVTLKVKHSDVWPIGTVVSIFKGPHPVPNTKPAGQALTSATVDAAGLLTFTVERGTPWIGWAEVNGVGKHLLGGDPTPDVIPPTLRERIAERRQLVGA